MGSNKEASISKKSLNVRGQLLGLDEPKIMGIINVTPDSFYSGSRFSASNALTQAGLMIKEGVHILDIGGHSTRPGAKSLSEDEELSRVIPVISQIHDKYPNVMISVDTFRAEVAKKAVQAGAGLINDVSGGQLDERMFETVAALQVPYVLMHMRGTPQTMRSMTDYDDLVLDLMDFFQDRINQLRSLGVTDIVIDLGFGFAKTLEQNFELLSKLEFFQSLGEPLLAGLSRKSMIFKSLNVDVSDSLNGTTALHMAALMKGASILRVHDVKEAKETVELYKLLKG